MHVAVENSSVESALSFRLYVSSRGQTLTCTASAFIPPSHLASPRIFYYRFDSFEFNLAWMIVAWGPHTGRPGEPVVVYEV